MILPPRPTTLTPERLADLHAKGRQEARRSSFVNPYILSECQRALAERGEQWAESVLLRRITQRSRINRNFPWLEIGEPEILVLADIAETRELLARAREN